MQNGEENNAFWLRWLTAAMWVVAGLSMAAEVYLRAPQRLRASCLLSWLAAFALCGASFWLTSRAGRPLRASLRWEALLLVQAASVIFMIAWWESVLGCFLLVFVAWQGAQVWSWRRSVLGVALWTVALAIVMVPHHPPLLWTMATLMTGGLQLLAVLAAQMVRAEAAAKLALARTNEELREVQGILAQSSRAAERLRLARELHDGLGHRLAALSLTLEAARHQHPDQAMSATARAHRIVGGLLAELRRVVSQMREEPTTDIASALRELTAEIQAPRVHLLLRTTPGEVDAARTHALVRCAQEMLTNAIKHSGAANLWLELDSTGPEAVLTARDDGRGVVALREGNGLRGMRERVAQLGGRLELSPGSGGFAARVWVPRAQVSS